MRPRSIPTSIFRPISTAATSRASPVICSAARWRASCCGSLARSIPPLEPIVARLTNGVMFKFPIARCRRHQHAAARFRRGGVLQRAKARSPPSGASPIPCAARISRRATITTRWSGISSAMRSALIENNPDVTFDIYFPPYSILQFVAMRDASPATLKIVYDFTAYAFPRLTAVSQCAAARFPRGEGGHPRSRQLRRRHPPFAGGRSEDSVVAGGGRNIVVDPRTTPLASLERLKAQVEAYKTAVGIGQSEACPPSRSRDG